MSNLRTDPFTKNYICSWSRVLNYISTVDDIPAAVLQSGKLRDRDRNTIKEKFAVSTDNLEAFFKMFFLLFLSHVL